MAEIVPGVFTIGHSTHELAAFLALLERHEIELVADVRAHPGSRRHPQFGSAALATSLAERGVGYEHLPQLGGRRRPRSDSPNAGWSNPQFRGYADHMASEEFARGVERLEELARGRRVTVMCAEAQWWRCHRQLVADAMCLRGFRVEHVGSGGGRAAHELTSFAVVRDGGIVYPSAQGAFGA